VRVVLSTWGSRGDVEPLAGLAVRLRELGAEVRVCAPPDEEFVALLAGVGVPLVPLGPSVRSVVTGVKARQRRTRSGSRPSWSPRGSTRSPRRLRDVTRWWRPA
jgi:UDP:flavonoid glycosyltransferase YjiC (YdhE family)